ncbi:PIN domain-containing protein [Haloferula sargassicola]|uniref:Ribonuclease VapC n=1 Tax=Haloferula sargassicola TaxID=490096 RepID=A0ABP9UT89_9BACT
MKAYLLDVNVLVAWGWADHEDHGRVTAWVKSGMRRRSVRLLTSAIPELGFVRVSVQRTAGRLPVAMAAEVLRGLIEALGERHEFVPDSISSAGGWPEWCDGASRTTDSHLLALASHHGAELATLDQGIPGAFLVPRLPIS